MFILFTKREISAKNGNFCVKTKEYTLVNLPWRACVVFSLLFVRARRSQGIPSSYSAFSAKERKRKLAAILKTSLLKNYSVIKMYY